MLLAFIQPVEKPRDIMPALKQAKIAASTRFDIHHLHTPNQSHIICAHEKENI
jgi:hypothetical protein